jgi:hypothetical protein
MTSGLCFSQGALLRGCPAGFVRGLMNSRSRIYAMPRLARFTAHGLIQAWAVPLTRGLDAILATRGSSARQ